MPRQTLEIRDRDGSVRELDVTYGDARYAVCGCGCGQSTNWNNRRGGYSSFRMGHDQRLRGRLLSMARSGDALAREALELRGWTRFLTENVWDPTRNGRAGGRRRSTARSYAVTGAVPTGARRFGVEVEFFGITATAAAAALRAAGLEAESESYNHRTRPHWKITTDASVSSRGTGEGRGLEMVSPILAGEQGLEDLGTAIRAIKQAGGTIDSTCGIHVHVDANDLTGDQIAAWFMFYVDRQSAFDLLLAKSRRPGGTGSRWCKHWAASTARSVAQRLRNGSGVGNVDRYHTINVASYPRHGTIEVRQHQGSLNGTKVVNWVKLLLAANQAAISGRAVRTDLPGMLADLEMDDSLKAWFIRRARELGATIEEQMFERPQPTEVELTEAAPTPSTSFQSFIEQSLAGGTPVAPIETEDEVVVQGNHRVAAAAVAGARPRPSQAAATRTVTFRNGRTVTFGAQ